MSLRHLGAAAVALMGLVAIGVPTARGTPTPSSVAKSLSQWQQARNKEADLRETYSTLEHRIAALKRLRASRPLAVSPELDRLLKESVVAAQAIDARAADVRARGEQLRRVVRAEVQQVDKAIRALVPKVKKGNRASRRRAARRIIELRDLRTELRGVLSTLNEAGQASSRWGEYRVRIDPLDGPNELAEKADFVQDARDKVRKKRQMLAQLLVEAKQAAELSQVAREFTTDTRLFDEGIRQGRVLRRSRGASPNLATSGSQDRGTENEVLTGREPNNGPASDPMPAGSPLPTPPGDLTQQDGKDVAFENPDPQSRGGAEPPESGGAGGGASYDDAPSTPTAPQANGIDPTPIERALNPSALLKLRISQLADGQADLATLERLLNELDRLDAFMKKQASTLQQRAEQLEQDEARILGE